MQRPETLVTGRLLRTQIGRPGPPPRVVRRVWGVKEHRFVTGLGRDTKEVGMSTTQERTHASTADTDEGVRQRVAVMGDALTTAAGSVAAAASDAMSQVPAMAGTARTVVIDANRRIRAGSDEVLIVGGALSFGFALGLLFGGANRLVVAAAMLPAASMGLTILERANEGWIERGPRPAG